MLFLIASSLQVALFTFVLFYFFKKKKEIQIKRNTKIIFAISFIMLAVSFNIIPAVDTLYKVANAENKFSTFNELINTTMLYSLLLSIPLILLLGMSMKIKFKQCEMN